MPDLSMFASHLPDVDYWSIRTLRHESEFCQAKKDVLEPIHRSQGKGYMVNIHHKGGYGYAASADFSDLGIRSTIEKAAHWAEYCSKNSITDYSAIPMPSQSGSYATPVEKAWLSLPLTERLELIRVACAELKKYDGAGLIVDWAASCAFTREFHTFWNSKGAHIDQEIDIFSPELMATAANDSDAQTRTLAGFRGAHQGGLEVMDQMGFFASSKKIADEAIQLLNAPNCPSGNMDILLSADQMMLQIHESIGHPIELDRILGDERNYAGTSFVKPEMFGSYQYGSKLLNVSFDPNVRSESASYAFDDDGTKAEKTYLIRDGILERPLGGTISQARAGLPGVANSRATSWNRPALDRMANLNVEPGVSSFDDMVSAIEKGVYMISNKSWSIDDSRNKFQFGCEWGQMIEKGRLTHVVKNPNYRGISANFWRNLKLVGDASTVGIFGTPHCGKAEPNQCIRVGHASPDCVFENIDVFGGEK